MPGGAAVEVRKTPESTTWYNATVLDVGKDTIRVEFEGEAWPSREVHAGLVRLRPAASQQQDESFNPQTDDCVEVRMDATEAAPCGWARGRIKGIENRVFYFVSFEGQRKAADRIVQKADLRRASSCVAIDPATLTRKLLPAVSSLHNWLKSPDSAGCLDDVASRTNLLAATITCEKGPPKVVLVGDEAAVHLGERLLTDIHFKNQIRIQGFHELRERYLENIQWYQNEWGAWHKEVFTLESSFVGRIIGSKGSNITKLREEYGVEIFIADDESGWESTITVTGEDPEAVRKCKEQMEFVTARIGVDPDKVGWILGRNYSELKSIADKANLVYARFDEKSSQIELCGLQTDVDGAKMMISIHVDYLKVYNDMSKERKDMDKEFRELDRKGGKGKARGGKDDWRGGKDGGKGGRDDYYSDSDDGGYGNRKGRGGDANGKSGKGKYGKGKDWDGKSEKGKSDKGKGKDDWAKGKDGRDKGKGKGGKKGKDDR